MTEIDNFCPCAGCSYKSLFQEGWRLEHETVEDEKSPILFKGVVFNEMKGLMVSWQPHDFDMNNRARFRKILRVIIT